MESATSSHLVKLSFLNEMRCLLLSPDFRQFHLVKRFPYRSSFPPLHFIGYQGARNRAREAVKRCSAGSLLNTGSSDDLTELNHGSQTATGRRRPRKVTNLPLRVRSVSSNGSSVEYANMYVCVRACMYVCWAFCHVIQVQNVSFHLRLILHIQASVP